MQASELLTQARQLYDDATLPFARSAVQYHWRSGFTAGGEWMRSAMAHLRGTALPEKNIAFNQWGFLKYGLALSGALLYSLVLLWLEVWWLLPTLIFVFYALEAQMVFLFPLLIDETTHIWRANRVGVRQAGGTFQVMWIVMQLAVVMLFGGFVGQGFVRSWALGCLSVVIWYEELRRAGHWLT